MCWGRLNLPDCFHFWGVPATNGGIRLVRLKDGILPAVGGLIDGGGQYCGIVLYCIVLYCIVLYCAMSIRTPSAFSAHFIVLLVIYNSGCSCSLVL
jgi:hypothetical protein